MSHVDDKIISDPKELMSKTARIKEIINMSIDLYVDVKSVVLHRGPKKTTATVTGTPSGYATPHTFVEDITNNYGDSAADGWMEGDILITGGRADGYKGDPVELHLKLVNIMKM